MTLPSAAGQITNRMGLRIVSLMSSIGLITLAACAGGGPDDASPQVLNSPAYVRVADRVFAAPVAEVAIVTKPEDCNCTLYSPGDEDTGQKDAERLAQDAAQRSKPIRVGSITIYPGATYERQGINSNCDASSVSWSCGAKSRGVARDLPQHVTITDEKFLKQFKAHVTVGGEKVFDHLVAIAPIGSKPKTSCDKASRFCTAAVLLSPDVIAIWDVWPNDRPAETTEKMAARQGRAISIVANGT